LCCPRAVWCHQRAVGQLRWFQTNTVGCPDWDFPWCSSVVRQIANASAPSVGAAPSCWFYDVSLLLTSSTSKSFHVKKNGKWSVSNAVLEPEFGEAERHLHAFRRVGYHLCQYVLISVSGPQAKSRDLSQTTQKHCCYLSHNSKVRET
jgi:hypothetical protein